MVQSIFRRNFLELAYLQPLLIREGSRFIGPNPDPLFFLQLEMATLHVQYLT